MNAKTIGCACRPEDGVRCEFHARQPRPCACGGTLQRYSGADGVMMVPYAPTSPEGYVTRGARMQFRPQHRAFWACNRCEFVQEEGR